MVLDPAARPQSHCVIEKKCKNKCIYINYHYSYTQKSRASLYCHCPDFLFRERAFSLDWSKQFSQSTHPNNIHKTTAAPASLSAFSRGCDMERAGKIWFMHELLCLLSKRRLFLCRWVVFPKNAPWWIASLIPSLHVLQDSRQVTATQDKSHLLLVIAQSVVLLFTGLLLMGDFALHSVQVDLLSRFWRGQNKDVILCCSALTSCCLLKL